VLPGATVQVTAAADLPQRSITTFTLTPTGKPWNGTGAHFRFIHYNQIVSTIRYRPQVGEYKLMARDKRELGSKLATYADTITAFAFVQSVTFSLALGSNSTFSDNAVRVWWLVPLFLIVANALYAYLVSGCHRGEDALLDQLEPPADRWEKTVRRWRRFVIGLGFILSLIAYTGTWYGKHVH
jgi:hypothetical protein